MSVKNCTLQSAAIAPLLCQGEVAGTVKLYQTSQETSSLQSLKMALAVASCWPSNEWRVLTTGPAGNESGVDALHAQINPHFLFYTLNTFYLHRTDPDTVRNS